jgi:Putative zinc-finger
MHWLNKHARFKDQLSPYLDGALSSTEIATLEAHLGTCEACRGELDELRATVAATRDLPQVDAPRSFALTPQMLEGRRPAAAGTSAPPLALGMRLASAGVAVFLAVVVIGDLSDAGDGGGGAREVSEELGAARMTAEFAGEAGVDKAESGVAEPAPDTTIGSTQEYDPQPPADGDTSAGANDSAACPPAAAGAASGGTSGEGAAGPASTDGAGTGAGGGVGGPVASPGVTPIPQPPATPTPAPGVETDTRCEDQPVAGAVAPTTSAPESEQTPDSAAEALSSDGAVAGDDGGVSTLRLLEIVLAAVLVVLITGVAVETLRRRRAA